ncbi:MAG: DUF349 domain-containing protein [Bacteroidaceae bacterium]|nr:DUF349 domain-containing protein [Bacteroidaceae bacterium]
MSETLNPDVQPSELNTANTPEQADNATMTELSYEQPVEETVEESSVTPEGECDNAGSRPSSRQEIIDRLKVIAESDDVLNCKAETEGLKVQFYRMRTAEIETAQQEFIAQGGDVSLFIPATDELEESFKEIMSLIKAKRNAWIAAQEQEMRANLEKKESLLAKLQSLVENASQGTPEVNEFKAIQSEWKEIKNVPQENVTSLWKQYQSLVEQFYDVLKINHEFREYDFKKNLEIKTRLCESAEALENEEDVINAFRQLQQLHNEFRETGPVSPELREEIWARFKAASTNVNRRHQEHFEAKKEQEKENLEKKSAICEQIEAINNNQLTSYQAWNSATEKILELQAQWKEIGFAPQKMNLKIFERFRAACDEFFRLKSEFFKEAKNALANNLERKKALCEQAEQLMESEEWKATADKLTKIQKEWKEIGPVPQKHSEALWKRFVTACDTFFERRNAATSSQRNIEQDNLKQKREVIEALKNIDTTLPADEQTKQISALTAKWNAIGFVPFKEKDKIYKEYKQSLNALYEKLHIDANERKLNRFRNSIGKSGNSLQRERDHLIRQYEAMKNEISTYENNIGFLSVSNKKGASLVDVMRQKVDKLKQDAQVILQKIHLIEEEIEKEEKQ